MKNIVIDGFSVPFFPVYKTNIFLIKFMHFEINQTYIRKDMNYLVFSRIWHVRERQRLF